MYERSHEKPEAGEKLLGFPGVPKGTLRAYLQWPKTLLPLRYPTLSSQWELSFQDMKSSGPITETAARCCLQTTVKTPDHMFNSQDTSASQLFDGATGGGPLHLPTEGFALAWGKCLLSVSWALNDPKWSMKGTSFSSCDSSQRKNKNSVNQVTSPLSQGAVGGWARISDTFLLTNKGPPKSTSRQATGAPNVLSTQ